MNLYDTLGIKPDANAAAIRKAYRQKASKAHTDRAGGDHAQMVCINRAYETLSDPDKRARYDATGEEGIAQTPADKAREGVMQLFIHMSEILPDGVDLVFATREQIISNQGMLIQQKGQLKEDIARMEKQRKRLKHKKMDARNFLDDLLASRIADKKGKLRSFDELELIAKLALALIDDYEWSRRKTAYPG